jgi:hypothetical protein
LEVEKIEYMLSLDEIQIWIDEFSFSGRDYLVQINDLKSKKIIWILRAKDNKLLEEVKQIAKASVDHYHLKQLLQDPHLEGIN